MFTRLTDNARRAMALANMEAHPALGPEHILLGIASVDSCTAARALGQLGITCPQLRAKIEELLQALPATNELPQFPTPEPRAKAVIVKAIEQARDLGHTWVGTEHLLLGLLHESEGIPAKTVAALDISLDQTRARILELLSGDDPGGADRT